MIASLVETQTEETKIKFNTSAKCSKCDHWHRKENEHAYGTCRIWTTLYAKKKLVPCVPIEYKIENDVLYVPYNEKCIYFSPKE